MDKKKRGGKREGAGRKPSGIVKKTVFLYVDKEDIFKFGNEEKMKFEVYGFIKGFGVVKKMEDKEPKYQSPFSTHEVLSQFRAYREELLACTDINQIRIILESVKEDKGLSGKDRLSLDEIAQRVINDKGIFED